MICEHAFLRKIRMELTGYTTQACCSQKGYGIFIEDNLSLEEACKILCEDCELKIGDNYV